VKGYLVDRLFIVHFRGLMSSKGTHLITPPPSPNAYFFDFAIERNDLIQIISIGYLSMFDERSELTGN